MSHSSVASTNQKDLAVRSRPVTLDYVRFRLTTDAW